MKKIILLIIFLLIFFPINSYGETYTKILGNQQTAQVSGFSAPNTKVSDDVYGGINYRAGYAISNEWKHGTVVGDFAGGYKEEDYGYISKLECGVEYHLDTAAFVAGLETFEVMVREKGLTIGEPSWLRNWNNPSPIVDNTAVGTSGQDLLWLQSVTPAVYTFYKTWARINASASDSKGYDIRVIWTPGGGLTSTSRVMIDQIYTRVLVKLVMYGIGLNSGATVTENASDLELIQIRAKCYSNTTIDVNSLKVDLKGTVVNSDITAVKLYYDVDEDGKISTGDTLVQSKVPTGLSVTFSASPLINNISHDSLWIVAVDLADNMTGLPKYVGAEITNQTFVTLAGTKDEVL